MQRNATQRMSAAEQVVHWFAENRDMEHPKLSSLPTAMQVRRMTQHNTPS